MAEEHTKKRRGRRWWVLRIAVFLGVAAVVLHWPSRVDIEIGPETTVIAGPVNDDGSVDYVSYLDARAAEGVTFDNNAAVLLVEAFGPDEMFPQEVRAESLRRLGMQGRSATGAPFIRLEKVRGPGPRGPGYFTEDTSFEDGLSAATKAPWPAERYPAVAKWIDDNASALDKVVAASARERCYLPAVSASDPPWMLGMLMPWLGAMPEAGWSLAARAMRRLQAGQVEQARADLLAVARLGRHFQHGRTLVPCLVGLGMEGIATTSVSAAAGSGKLTPAQLKAMLGHLDSLPAPGDIVTAVDRGERFSMLDSIMAVRRGVPIDEMQVEPGDSRSRRPPNLDWNVMLRMTNQWYDRIVAAIRLAPTAGRAQVANDLAKSIKTALARRRMPAVQMLLLKAGGWPCRPALSRRVCEILLAMVMPTLHRAADIQDRTRMQYDLTRLALALAIYKAEQDVWPDELQAVAPSCGGEIPLDRFTDKPLIYKPSRTGYLLYSLGSNGTDEGGRDEGYDQDDIRVGAGPDATPPPLSDAMAVPPWEPPFAPATRESPGPS